MAYWSASVINFAGSSRGINGLRTRAICRAWASSTTGTHGSDVAPSSKGIDTDKASGISKTKSGRKHLVFNNRTGPSLQHFLAQPLGAKSSEASAVEPEDIPYMAVSDWGEGRKYYVEVYGCQMNVNDTEILMSVLNKAG
ncbi:hypothetical protein LPJ66_010906, partial [Kickxella alabastrina]